MNTNELLKKIKRIEIKTKGLTKHIFSGEYHSSFKGRGMTFSEVREYQIGDDVRTIDWNVTARFNSPYIKVFEEERELTLMMIIDLSDSINFGSNEKIKKELIIEIVAVLAFSAESNNDKVGAIFLTDKVEKYIAPEKGKKHILFILREIIEFDVKSKKTDLNEGLIFFRNVIKKRSICIVISDFISEKPFLHSFNILKKKHDILALKIVDPLEYNLPNLGFIQLFNAEENKTTWIDTNSKLTQFNHAENYKLNEEKLKLDFKKIGIDYAVFDTTLDYIPVLMKLFQHRK